MIVIEWGLKQSAETASYNLLQDMDLLGEDFIDIHAILNEFIINNHHILIHSGYLENLKGYTFHKNGRFMICYDPFSFHLHNVRFTLGHELGHIYLGHFKENNIDSKEIYGRCEYEANYFSAALLMPEYLMYSCNTLSLDEISYKLKVSTESISYRINTLKDLYKNTGIHIGFCPTCGKMIYGKGAKYCAYCGMKITA